MSNISHLTSKQNQNQQNSFFTHYQDNPIQRTNFADNLFQKFSEFPKTNIKNRNESESDEHEYDPQISEENDTIDVEEELNLLVEEKPEDNVEINLEDYLKNRDKL